MLGCSANKALIAVMNLVVSASLIALQARLWVPSVNIEGIIMNYKFILDFRSKCAYHYRCTRIIEYNR